MEFDRFAEIAFRKIQGIHSKSRDACNANIVILVNMDIYQGLRCIAGCASIRQIEFSDKSSFMGYQVYPYIDYHNNKPMNEIIVQAI